MRKVGGEHLCPLWSFSPALLREFESVINILSKKNEPAKEEEESKRKNLVTDFIAIVFDSTD